MNSFKKVLPKIVLSTDLNNLRAQHVYEKIGFQKYDIQYNYWKDPQGENAFSYFYELLPQIYSSTKIIFKNKRTAKSLFSYFHLFIKKPLK